MRIKYGFTFLSVAISALSLAPSRGYAAHPSECQGFVDHVIRSVNALRDTPKSPIPRRSEIARSHDPSWLYESDDESAAPNIRIQPQGRGFVFPKMDTARDGVHWSLEVTISASKTYKYLFGVQHGSCSLQKVDVNATGARNCDNPEARGEAIRDRAIEACEIGKPFFKAKATRVIAPDEDEPFGGAGKASVTP